VHVHVFRPRQLAPLIVVRTTHYLSLSRAVGSILQKLDPPGRGHWAYEGIYFMAEDEKNVPFLSVSNVVRGQIEGSQWARSEALYPFLHG